MIAIHTFNSRAEATMAKMFLKANGIHAEIFSDDQGGMNPRLANAYGVELKVKPEDEEKAKKILEKRLKPGKKPKAK